MRAELSPSVSVAASLMADTAVDRSVFGEATLWASVSSAERLPKNHVLPWCRAASELGPQSAPSGLQKPSRPLKECLVNPYFAGISVVFRLRTPTSCLALLSSLKRRPV